MFFFALFSCSPSRPVEAQGDQAYETVQEKEGAGV